MLIGLQVWAVALSGCTQSASNNPVSSAPPSRVVCSSSSPAKLNIVQTNIAEGSLTSSEESSTAEIAAINISGGKMENVSIIGTGYFNATNPIKGNPSEIMVCSHAFTVIGNPGQSQTTGTITIEYIDVAKLPQTVTITSNSSAINVQ